jgi:hypothetical protein
MMNTSKEAGALKVKIMDCSEDFRELPSEKTARPLLEAATEAFEKGAIPRVDFIVFYFMTAPFLPVN